MAIRGGENWPKTAPHPIAAYDGEKLAVERVNVGGDMHSLRQAIEALTEEARSLVGRIEPLCVPQTPQDKLPSVVGPVRSELGAALLELTARVEDVRMMLLDCGRRLEV